MGDFEDCELCEGTGTVIPDRPTSVQGAMRALVFEARYAAGLPLCLDGDTENPRPIGAPNLAQLLSGNLEPVEEWDDDGSETENLL